MKSIHAFIFSLIPYRTLVLMVMLLSPLVIYGVCAGVAVWKLGWMRYLWWLAPAIWSITWLVSKLWKPDQTTERNPIEASHWTPRDRKAAELVRGFQEEAEFFNSDQLSDPRFYFNQALKIANELARHYDPETTDPVSNRTVAEILAACRLVADDLEEIVLTSVPGSRLLTVQQWKKLGDTPKVVRQLSKGFWATSILLNPFSLASWGTSKVTNEKVTNSLQTELLITLYMRFVRQLGYYLIEMNSGRLRGGADTYRAAFSNQPSIDRTHSISNGDLVSHSENLPQVSDLSTGSQFGDERSSGGSVQTLDSESGTSSGIVQPSKNVPASPQAKRKSKPKEVDSARLKIAVMGQKGSGKTSLVNALLVDDLVSTTGSQFIPSPTKSLRRYQINLPHQQAQIELLDTPGYQDVQSNTRLKRHWQRAFAKGIELAAKQANAILLTLNAEDNDRHLDLALLQGVRKSYSERANLRPPPVIAVLVFPAWETDSNQPQHSAVASQAVTTENSSNEDTNQSSVQSNQINHTLPSQRISQLLNETRERFGDLIDDVIPIFHDIGDDFSLESRRKSVAENLLPSLARQLDSIQSAAKLIDYEQSLNKAKYRILFQQAKTSGKRLLSGWLNARSKRKK